MAKIIKQILPTNNYSEITCSYNFMEAPMRLFKKPTEKNFKSGNVTLSYTEFNTLSSGGYDYIVALDCVIPTAKFMIDNAKDMDKYMLVPIFATSYLVKKGA
jgi:hypothetical protein